MANRHALIAATFGVGALLAHDRARRDGWRWGAWLGPALLGAGLHASEMALSTTAILFAHALWIDPHGPRHRRLSRLLPYLLVVIAWQALYASRGYGAVGSGGYLHPLHDAGAYLSSLPARALAHSIGQLTPIAADFWPFLPTAVSRGLAALSLGFLLLAGRALLPSVRSTAAGRFALLGAALSLLPIASAGPGDRNLVFVGIGASAALAVALDACLREPPSSRLARGVVAALVTFNLAVAPALLPLKCLANFNLDRMRAEADASLPRGASLAAETLVVVSVATEGTIFFVWAQRDAAGVPVPRGTRILSTGPGPTTVTRADPATLRVRPDGGFLAGEMQRLMRSPTRPFRRGEVIALSDMRATVVSVTPDGRPDTVDFRFATPLEAPGRRWMRGRGLGLIPWRPPAAGETVVVPSASVFREGGAP